MVVVVDMVAVEVDVEGVEVDGVVGVVMENAAREVLKHFWIILLSLKHIIM